MQLRERNNMVKKSWFRQNREEISWNIINSILAGLLVLLGSFTTGNINSTSIIISIATALIVAVNKFKDYWLTQEKEVIEFQNNQVGLFNFF